MTVSLINRVFLRFFCRLDGFFVGVIERYFEIFLARLFSFFCCGSPVFGFYRANKRIMIIIRTSRAACQTEFEIVGKSLRFFKSGAYHSQVFEGATVKCNDFDVTTHTDF